MKIKEFIHQAIDAARYGEGLRDRCGSVSSRDGVIYSYAEPMVFKDKQLQRWILSGRSWSLTTSRHQNYIRQSLTESERANALTVYALPGEGEDWHADHHAENVVWYNDTMDSLLQEFDNKAFGKTRRLGAYNEAYALLQMHRDYARLFNLANPLSTELMAREEEAHELRQRVVKTSAATDAEREARREKNLESWLMGKRKQPPAMAGYSDYARPEELADRGWQLVTNRGALVPLAAAPVVWAMSNAALAGRQVDIDKAGARRIGVFTLDRVDADGDVHIGCHTFTRRAIERMAELLGLKEGVAANIPDNIKALLQNGAKRCADHIATL